MRANGSGQFGPALRHRLAVLGTDLSACTMNHHGRTPSIRLTNPSIAGGGYGVGVLASAPTHLTDANGLNYAMQYADDIQIFGITAQITLSGSSRVYGEIAVRPYQPLGLNASDVIAAFLTRSATAALSKAKGVPALPPGATFDGYNRYRVTTRNAELGWGAVAGLPDQGVLRYGRSDDYGQAAVTGGAACVDTTPAQKTCAQEGFVTAIAWRLPPARGGNYNTPADRDSLAMFVGVKF